MERKKRNEREANRVHCRQTRERKKEKERMLKEEVEALTLYRAIVEDGPDLFSCHRVELDAPFTFLCDNYYQRLQLVPEDVLGRPLASIVDPRDAYTLRTAVCQVLNTSGGGRGGAGAPQSGTLVDLRVSCGRISCQASMTMIIGSQGLIIVTRLYDVCYMGDAREERGGVEAGAGGFRGFPGAELNFRQGACKPEKL